MHYLISIIDVVLIGKENYTEWYRNIKSTLVLNDLWKGICEAATVSQSSKITKEEAQ
jgi:hypothetical protein